MAEKQEDSYRHVLKYTGLFGGVQGLNILIGLVRNKLVAMLLGPDGMGLMSLFNSSVNFISQATNMGISFSAVRNVSEYFDQGDEHRIAHFVQVVRGWSLFTALLGMLACILLGPMLSSNTFSWGNHTFHFVMLSPAVGLLAVLGGEMAILKGTRRLRSLAVIQLGNVFLALLYSVPLFYLFGQKAIVPVIVLSALSSVLLTVWHSYRLYPLRLSGLFGILGEGMEMVRLGVAFVVAGIMGSGAEMVIRSYLNVAADLNVVGLYNAGFMITITYAGLVFSAMETDYFPRLSATPHQPGIQSETVNRQIEVSVLLVSPMLCALIVGLPVLIPMLYSSAFVEVVGMAQVAVFSMYIKAVSLPISYLTLARGDSLAYMLIESVEDVLLVFFVVFGFRNWGLLGTGIALVMFYLLDIVVIYVYTHLRYGYQISSSVLNYLAMQLPLGIAAYIVTFVHNPYIYWALGILLSFASLMVSVYVLHQKTALWGSLTSKLKNKFRRHV